MAPPYTALPTPQTPIFLYQTTYPNHGIKSKTGARQKSEKSKDMKTHLEIHVYDAGEDQKTFLV